MISAGLELRSPVYRDGGLHQLQQYGEIQHTVATEAGWDIGVVFPDFGSARGFFEHLSAQPVEFDVRWVVQDHNPFNGSYVDDNAELSKSTGL